MRFSFGFAPNFGSSPFGNMPPPPRRIIVYGGSLVKCPDGVYRPYYEQARFLLTCESIEGGERLEID